MKVGEIKSIDVTSQTGEVKQYDIKKGNVSDAMELQGIIFTLIKNSGTDLDSDIKAGDFIFILQCGLNKESIPRIKEIIISLTNAPKIDIESFELLDPATVITLLVEHFNHTVKNGEKKSQS